MFNTGDKITRIGHWTPLVSDLCEPKLMTLPLTQTPTQRSSITDRR